MNEEKTIIRASSLPHYSDCMRRSAAKMFSSDLAQFGYEIRYTSPSIGAAVGTATHAALEKGLLLKHEGYLDFADKMKETSVESLESSISTGVVWDQTTRNKDEGIIQAVRQARIVLEAMPKLKKFVVERAMTAAINDKFLLSGHIDICEFTSETSCIIYDLKTGKMIRQNIAQYGGYSMLAHANGYEVDGLGEIYVKRVAAHRPQPDPEIVYFNVSQAEMAAYHTFNQIIADIEAFRKEGDPWRWLPNPNSMMCSPDYCPAYDTSFCDCNKRREQ